MKLASIVAALALLSFLAPRSGERVGVRGVDAGCVTCHKNIEPMHASPTVKLSCTDCHGGNATAQTKNEAHVHPLHPEVWTSSANPQRSYTALLRESPEFVRFIN